MVVMIYSKPRDQAPRICKDTSKTIVAFKTCMFWDEKAIRRFPPHRSEKKSCRRVNQSFDYQTLFTACILTKPKYFYRGLKSMIAAGSSLKSTKSKQNINVWHMRRPWSSKFRKWELNSKRLLNGDYIRHISRSWLHFIAI